MYHCFQYSDNGLPAKEDIHHQWNEGYRKYIDKTLELGDDLRKTNVNYMIEQMSLDDLKEYLQEFTPKDLDGIKHILWSLDFSQNNEKNCNAIK